jgi:foldase protein PrsA
MTTHLMIVTRARRHTQAGLLAVFAATLCLAATLAGCTRPSAAEVPPSQTMTDAMTARPDPMPVPPPAKGHPAAVAVPIAAPAPVQAIATVDGRNLSYSAWLNLMKKSHGLSAFQQILAVELARQMAEAKGIVLTEPQLETAFRQEIAEVVGPETKDPAESERLLRAILTRRGVSMEEFRLSAYRNAYLRRIAEPIIEAGITDDALKIEFDRQYGPKVQVRHIQVSDSATISKVMEALEAGQDFSDLARQLSQNLESAPDGGLLAPFSRLDPGVPPELREVAFGLELGQVSGAVRVDGWTQIFKLEKRLPAEPVEFDKVAADVRRSLKDQLVRQKMQELLRNKLQSASIQVYDEELGKQFQSLRQAKP